MLKNAAKSQWSYLSLFMHGRTVLLASLHPVGEQHLSNLVEEP